MRSLLPLILCSLFLSSCLTFVKDPGSYRKNHPNNLGGGLNLASSSGSLEYMRNIGENFAVRVGAEKKLVTTKTIKLGEESNSINDDAIPAENDRMFYEQHHSLALSNLVFPWRSSSFFLGTNFEARFYQTAYTEHTSEFALSHSTTNVEWQDRAMRLGFPVGLSMNTENNFTLLGAISPTYTISNQRTFIDDGSDQQVDAEKRTLALSTVDRSRRFEWSAISMLAYSF